MFNIALNVLLSLAAVFGNALFFAAYYLKRSLRRPANAILVSLAAINFITGTIMQPFFICEILLMLGDCEEKICAITSPSRAVMTIVIVATVFNQVLATLDRYIAVCHSYRYIELVTNSRVTKSIAILWLGAICIALSKIVHSKVGLDVQTIVIGISVIVIVSLYFKISQEISRLDRHAVVALSDPEEERNTRERKRAKTVAITLGVLALCFLSMLISGFLYNHLSYISFVFTETLFVFARTAIFSNSSFNVLIYYWRNEEIRKTMLAVVKKITQGANPEE